MRILGTVNIAIALGLAVSLPARSAPVDKDVTVLSFNLHYLEAGSGAPVVLLHGLGGDGSRWGPNIEALSREFRVLALDEIGFGESDKPLANYHTGMLSEFLVGFLDALGIDKASLVGNSMGAAVAAYTAVHYPNGSTVSFSPMGPDIAATRKRRAVPGILTGDKSRTA